MLDQVDFIKRYDKADSLGVLAGQLGQLRHSYVAAEGLEKLKLANIVVAGMGGSALAAEFIRGWLVDRLPAPIEIVRDYQLPAYVGEETLVVCSSYSGGTEETLAAFDEASERGAQVVVMTAGGKLLAAAKRDGRPYFELPSEVQGRYGVLFGVRAWAQLLEGLGSAEGLVRELETAAAWAEGEIQSWAPGIMTESNGAKQIAQELVGHGAVVYGGPTLAAMAMKWKLDLNENAKNVAFWNSLPEMNHNEFSGWGHPDNHGFKVVELISELDPAPVGRRFKIMNELLSSRWAPIQVGVAGQTRLEQMLWSYMLGSLVSAYLGILNQVDIGTLPMVDTLKQRLN